MKFPLCFSKKNMELEPYNRKVTDKFYKLLSLNRHRQFGY